jgi:N-methylhydantoinase A/oxoprolinase/acetone carboxylase beta subunit
MSRKVRIGIDVGGTFTDAVAIDSQTLEIIDQIKVQTTHKSSRGVAEGVIHAIQTLLASPKFDAGDVVFIAHGTTQATNALLEGDVVDIGIIGMSSGLDSLRAKGQANVSDISLSQGHILHTSYRYLNSGEMPGKDQVEKAVQEMAEAGAKSFVASESYSVDDPRNELHVIEIVQELGYPVTGTHQISKRYGLKIRTRTSVINASILPKMIHTANMTEASVKEAGIQAPLMIMRGDGGAMSVDEMRKRPILTLLSGPAAGVAGALMYARVSDGIFLEVGGTSTDISAIRNGQVLVDYAEVGGHSTYLPSLDVHTVGIAGGSMIRLRKGTIAEVGPRSAHIAGLRYAVYADPSEIVDPEIEIIRPLPEDPEEYVAIRTKNGEVFALTLSDAANIAGIVSTGVYAAGNVESARRAFQPLAVKLGKTVEETATMVLERAIEKVIPPVQFLMKKYGLTPSEVVLVGGGGGAAVVVPYLGQKLGYRHEIASNAEVISTIGVALALVRDMVERTIPNPTKEDIVNIRKEAEMGVINMGAVPETVDVTVEVDSQMSLVRAIATGALEMRSRDLTASGISQEEKLEIAGRSFGTASGNVQLAASTGSLDVFAWKSTKKIMFGIFSETKQQIRVMDKDGVIRLKLNNAEVASSTAQRVTTDLAALGDRHSAVKESGMLLPNMFILYSSRIVNMTGLASIDQIQAIALEEMAGIPPDGRVLILADKR